MMSDIDKLNLDIQKYKYDIAVMEALQRLETNSDFRLLKDNYCINECSRLIALSVDPNIDNNLSTFYENKAKATGYFIQYLQEVINNGTSAKIMLIDAQNLLSNNVINED